MGRIYSILRGKSMIYNEDCINGSKSHFKDEQMDLIICDPPFGINESTFDKHYNRKENNIISGYKEAPKDYNSFSYEWLKEAKRILKENGSIYVISGWTNLHHIINAMEKLGFNIINHIIWKYNFGVYTKKKFVSSHYHIIYATKCNKSKPVFNTNCRFGSQEKDTNGGSLVYQDLEDVWIINKEFSPGQIKNKNKLPEELLSKIIQYSSNKDDKICDFFLGNFTTAIVAKKLGRQTFGFELNKESFDHNIQILNNIKYGSELENLKKVINDTPKNAGKELTDEEIINICDDFDNLKHKGTSKKDAIEKLGAKYGRGKFSITNILKRGYKETLLNKKQKQLISTSTLKIKTIELVKLRRAAKGSYWHFGDTYIAFSKNGKKYSCSSIREAKNRAQSGNYKISWNK